jgi:hypothetical protein
MDVADLTGVYPAGWIPLQECKKNCIPDEPQKKKNVGNFMHYGNKPSVDEQSPS